MSRPFPFASLAFVALFAGFAQAQVPAFATQTPTAGNSANTFFVFLPVANVGTGDASNIQLTSVALNFLGSPATTVIQPATLPFTPGTGFLGAGGVRILDLEFDNTPLVSGNTYALVVSGTYQANGTTNNFALNYSPLVYASGFTATHDQVLDVIGWKLDAFPEIYNFADYPALLAFISGVPQVMAVEVGDPATAVSVKFSDGREPILLEGDIPPLSLTVQPITGHDRLPVVQPLHDTGGFASTGLRADAAGSPPSRPTEMPASPTMRLLFALDPTNANSIPTIQPWLVKQGYQPVTADASVAGLRSVGGDGIFYIDSHGSAKAEINWPYHIWTTTPVPVDPAKPDALTQADICPHSEHPYPCGPDLDPQARLVVATLRDHYNPATQQKENISHYGITAYFVNYYWKNFSENALVYIDTCDSDKLIDPTVLQFQDAIFQKHGSVYLGWTGKVGDGFAADTAKLVFDRLLGANKFCQEGGQSSCAPGEAGFNFIPQRPFDYTQVATDVAMHHLNLYQGTNGAAEITFTRNFRPNMSSNFGLLAPTISYLSMDEINQQLTIHGVFGEDQGKVTVGGTTKDGSVVDGGQEVHVASWDWDHIVVDLPLTGAGSAGNVQVTARMHTSNVAQLTEWRSNSFTWAYNEGTLQEQTTYDIHLRADIRKYRKIIHKAPDEPMTTSISSANDSTATFLGSGKASSLGASYTLSGQGTLSNVQVGGTNNFFILAGHVDHGTQVTFALAAVSTNGCTCTVCVAGNCTSSPMPVFGPSNWDPLLGLQSFMFAIDDDGSATIQNGSPPAVTDPFTLCNLGVSSVSGQLKWGSIQATPNTAPDPKSGR